MSWQRRKQTRKTTRWAWQLRMCHGTHQHDGLKQICNNVLIGHFLTTQFQSLLLAITPGNARGSLHHNAEHHCAARFLSDPSSCATAPRVRVFVNDLEALLSFSKGKHLLVSHLLVRSPLLLLLCLLAVAGEVWYELLALGTLCVRHTDVNAKRLQLLQLFQRLAYPLIPPQWCFLGRLQILFVEFSFCGLSNVNLDVRSNSTNSAGSFSSSIVVVLMVGKRHDEKLNGSWNRHTWTKTLHLWIESKNNNARNTHQQTSPPPQPANTQMKVLPPTPWKRKPQQSQHATTTNKKHRKTFAIPNPHPARTPAIKNTANPRQTPRPASTRKKNLSTHEQTKNFLTVDTGKTFLLAWTVCCHLQNKTRLQTTFKRNNVFPNCKIGKQ